VRDGQCEVHEYLMPDGRCTCSRPKDPKIKIAAFRFLEIEGKCPTCGKASGIDMGATDYEKAIEVDLYCEDCDREWREGVLVLEMRDD
jgi:hypothetical protein